MLAECVAQIERATVRLEDAIAARDLDRVIAAVDHWVWCLEQLKRIEVAEHCEICGLAGAKGDPKLCADCRADVNQAMPL